MTAAAGLARLSLYLTTITAPLILAAVLEPRTDHGFRQELAKSFALVGFSILAMQFVIGARIGWIERPFGLDQLFQFHKRMAVFATCLLLAHPVLYAWGGEWSLLTTFDQAPPVLLGKIALGILVVIAVSSVFRRALRLDFERWRLAHNTLALTLLLAGFVHSLYAGGDLKGGPMRLVWGTLLGLALASYSYHKVFARRRVCEIVDVQPAADGVWTLKMRPVGDRMDYRAGQFAFLTLKRGRGLPIEEHPFTLSSSPTSEDLAMTIKVAGDFTATIAHTRVADRALIHGPFGRFTYEVHADDDELVFIAGGIGVTPFLSMLRHMRDTETGKKVVLLFANRSQEDIVAREELAEIASGVHPSLKVVHVVSGPDPTWDGERGRIDAELIQRHLGEELAKMAFYVCGPPAMITDVTGDLRRLGVRCCYTERFAL